MNIPNQVVVGTKEYIQIQTKVLLYAARFGCKAVDAHLDGITLRMFKQDGKHLGAYIENKICQEYQITRYDLMESTGRQNITEARQLLCVFAEKYVHLSRTDMSLLFNRSRHFAKRMIGSFQQKLKENHRLDKELIDRYRRLDALISAYSDFKPHSNEKP